MFTKFALISLLGLAAAQVNSAATEDGSAAGADISNSKEWTQVAATQDGSAAGADPVSSGQVEAQASVNANSENAAMGAATVAGGAFFVAVAALL